MICLDTIGYSNAPKFFTDLIHHESRKVKKYSFL